MATDTTGRKALEKRIKEVFDKAPPPDLGFTPAALERQATQVEAARKTFASKWWELKLPDDLDEFWEEVELLGPEARAYFTPALLMSALSEGPNQDAVIRVFEIDPGLMGPEGEVRYRNSHWDQLDAYQKEVVTEVMDWLSRHGFSNIQKPAVRGWQRQRALSVARRIRLLQHDSYLHAERNRRSRVSGKGSNR